MSTEGCTDIFYQVKKEILDKLDLILQKVNLQIINSTHARACKPTEDFTFIELSQFQSQISSLFLYLDKLYDSLNSSVSGYGSQTHSSIPNQSSQLNLLYEKIVQQNIQLKQQIEEVQTKLATKLKQQETNMKKYVQTTRKLTQKIRQLSKVLNHQVRQVNLAKKCINSKLKQFKFEMLQARVEIIAKIKQRESIKKEKEVIQECTCHYLLQHEGKIIKELNEILKMC